MPTSEQAELQFTPLTICRNDTLVGTSGGDNIFAFAGDDELFGRGGRDELFGEKGFDLLEGGSARDTLFGGSKDDRLRGQNGDDELNGGGGDDSLSGGRGDDVLTGGSGADQFNFNVNSTSAAGEDTITDFEDGTDVINLGDFGDFEDLDSNDDGKLNNQDEFVTKNGNVTTIDVGQAFGLEQPGPDPEVLTVVSSSNNALNEADFLFLA